MDYREAADKIMKHIGGVENVMTLTHCMTRLRFVLKDENAVNLNAVKEIKGVLGATFGAGQFQVIMGRDMLSTFDMIMKNYNIPEPGGSGRPENKKPPQGIKGLLIEGVNFVSGSVSPVITGLVAGGMMKLALFFASMFFPGVAETSTYAIITFMADVPFYFMPVFVAYGASRKLGCAPVYAMLVACALIHPNFMEMITAGKDVRLFGLPVLLVKYSSSMIPAILSTVVVYHLEKFFNKIIPGICKTIFVGVLTVLTASILTFTVLGPLGTYIGNYVMAFFIWLQKVSGPVALAALAATFPFLVMLGMHTLTAPILVQSMTTLGFDPLVRPALILHIIAEGGGAIGVALRTKNKELRSEALSVGIGSVLAGISEPVIYGVALRYKKPFIGICAGGFAGGIVAGLLHVRAFVMGKSTIFALPIFQETMLEMAAACAVTFIVALVVCFLVGIDEETEGLKPAVKAEKG